MQVNADLGRALRALVVATGCAVFAWALSSCGASSPEASGSGTGDAVALEEYRIDTDLINESSGLARSQVDPQLLWTHNDSGGAATAYAVDHAGHYQGSLKLNLAANLDWEDMTSFVEDGQPRLLLADIGDNSAFRPVVTLYIVDEPDTTQLSRPFELSATPVRTITLIYPDGPRDAESIAVDAAEGSVYLLSKRDAVPQLYRVPLAPTVPLVVAEALGEIAIPRAPDGSADPEQINWTTSMDINAAADALVVVSLSQAHVYHRVADESWLQSMQRSPVSLDLPEYPQIEAVAWDDAGELWITSEGEPAPLARLHLH
ncbi:hypothetical protein E4T66_14110 [Sinimarinibacterium sp. CAU 1509]|uniref:hypothetical protein n=1 Tax=Sinimarinibacterium sp. CAU 1509 TaxID=2562283 RepID=UPI0010ACFAE4|nr:hypothetical protein [Sinimarinibacterium sp. CAU 1509]TJY59508.1 hypothetical protein E4T66_14110 [Sinimarinibacterium sp. CAU 1509]